MNNKPVIIIGGGIGGLTLANALLHMGIPFELYEKAPELTDVGAGIGLSHAPLTIFDSLGIGNEVRKNSAHATSVYFPDKNLKIRGQVTPQSETVCIHRAKLIEILKKNLPEKHIHLSHTLEKIEVGEYESTLLFENGTQIQASRVVAADGINSVIRQQIFPEISIRYINQTIWRGITDTILPEPFQNSYLEIWDESLRYLAIPINNTQTCWLCVQKAAPGGKDNPNTVRDDLLQLFRNFHPLLKELIQKTNNVIRNDMGDLGTRDRSWFKNGLVFLGDAIHATTPNLAQGGCQAIEDAWCLTNCLAKYPDDTTKAYSVYEKLRKPKAMKIVSDSWLIGVAAHSRNPILHYGLRAIINHSPAFVLRKQEALLNDLSYLQKI